MIFLVNDSTYMLQLTSPVAPNNCLQFYTDLEGWFQTFNYDDTSLFITERYPSYFVSFDLDFLPKITKRQGKLSLFGSS